MRSLLSKLRFSSLVTRETQGQIGIITLDNEKKRNTLSKDTLNQLLQQVLYFADQRQQKVLIIKAKGTDHLSIVGPVFSTGHDLKELLSDT
jgi:enoyl-CoA hydratase/carnithine racemase